MKIEVRLFASLKEIVGRQQIVLELAEPATVADVRTAVCQTYPALTTAVASSIVAVNQTFAENETAVNPHDEIAIFPPVSGGQPAPHPTYFAITPDPIDLHLIQQRLTQPDVGAIVTFTGIVRGQTDRPGLPTVTHALEYEAYSAMAEAKMAQIAAEIWQRWTAVKGIAIVQRIGNLAIGDGTTLVACAASHRDQGAFEAARYGIDRLKEIVPVWKKEIGPDRSIWVEGHYQANSQDN